MCKPRGAGESVKTRPARSRIIASLLGPAACFCLLLCTAPRLRAAAPEAPSDAPSPDYSANTKWFPNLFLPYMPEKISAVDLSNTKTLEQMVREGKIELSAAQFVAAVVENDLDLTVDRYNISFAQSDILRTKGGQAARGVSASGASVPTGLSSAAIGAGIGNLGGLGGIGVTGSYSGSERSLNITPRGEYDPTLLFNYSWDRTTSPLDTLVISGIPSVTPNTSFYQFGWEQAFTSGTSFSVQVSNQRQSTTQEGLIYNPTVISRMSTNVVQQVWNGFGFAVNRRYETVARNNFTITREWFRQQVDTIVAQALDSYWSLVSAQEQVRSSQQALQTSQQLYQNDQKELAVGLLPGLDVTSAESQVAAAKRDLIIAQTNLQEQEAALKYFFCKQITPDLQAASVVATDTLPTPQDVDIPPLDEALATAIQNRPELPQAEGAVKNYEVSVKSTRNNLLPTFNIFGDIASAGLAGNELIATPGGLPVLISGGLGQEFTQFIHFKFPEYSFGFALTIPLRNRAAQADNITAQLNEKQAEVAFKQAGNQVTLEVRNAIIGITQAKAEVAAAVQAAALAQQSLEAEQKKLLQGMSTTYNVILMEQDLYAAQLAEAQARVSYANALVEMSRSMGVLLGRYHINFQDAVRGHVSPQGS